jgi:hypothetical protein
MDLRTSPFGGVKTGVRDPPGGGGGVDKQYGAAVTDSLIFLPVLPCLTRTLPALIPA